MQRNTALKIVNPLLGALALSQILSGVCHDFLPRQLFWTVHRAVGLSFAVAAVLHVILNWNWIRANFFRGVPPGGG